MRPTRIIIFAKAPEPCFAKTRLIPVLGAQGAADLARRMLLHTLNEALAADIGTVELCATPALNDAAWRAITLPVGIATSDQGEGNLGARMARAAQRAIEQGECVLLIGTDCVEMSAELLHRAGQMLGDHEAVIHCTADGGYALLGLTRFSPLLFNDIPWSTDEVASLTIARLGQLGRTLHVGAMLHDVDEPDDLDRLPPHWSVDVAA